MFEEWRPIPGYEGVYAVSDAGRVMRVSGGRGSTAGRILTAKRGTKGYLHVDLSRQDVKCRFGIHRLVALAFIGPPPDAASEPNHKNGAKTDNAPSNLEWLSRLENVRHAFASGLWRPGDQAGEKNGRAKLTAAQVNEIRALRGLAGQREIAGRFGVARSLVQRIHQGRAWR